MAIERFENSDEDAEKVAAQKAVARRVPPDRPGTEPPGLSRADSRAAARAANKDTTSTGMADKPDTSSSSQETHGNQDSHLVDAGEVDERDTSDDGSNERPDGSDEEDAPRSAWDAPGVADHPEKPEIGEIRFTQDRRAHTLDGDARGGGHRYGTGRAGKTEFPANWGDDTIVAHIIDVARNPDTAEFQKRGTWKVRNERDGVEINVAVKPDGRIWTAFPSPGGRGVIENPRED